MSVETGLAAELLGNAGVAALVGERVYPLLIPQTVARPAIAYQVIGGPGSYSQTGSSHWVATRMQITCVAQSYADAKATAGAVKTALEGFVGNLGGLYATQGIFLENEMDGFGSDTPIPDTTPKTVRLDFTIQGDGR